MLCGVQIQLIHSEHMDFTMVPWETLASSVVSLASINDLHHWLIIKWCLSCLNPAHLFTWLESYNERSNEWDRRPWIEFHPSGMRFHDSYKITNYDYYDHKIYYRSIGPHSIISWWDFLIIVHVILAYILSMGMIPSTMISWWKSIVTDDDLD